MLYSEKVEKAEHAVKAWRYQNSSEPGVPSAPGLKMIKLSASAQKLQRQGPFYPHRFQPILSQSAHLKKKKNYSHLYLQSSNVNNICSRQTRARTDVEGRRKSQKTTYKDKRDRINTEQQKS